MKQPHRFVAQGKTRKMCNMKKPYGLKMISRAWLEVLLWLCKSLESSSIEGSLSLFSVYIRKRGPVIYVNDIVITGDYAKGINDLKFICNKNFGWKDHGLLSYLLDIEVARSRESMCLGRKYVFDILTC